ncbi:FecR family protein [Pedobacter nyackensis]|uniref:FecR family protein n=1 Tax=Pedobacter nyackensis TaxID=475255 RepID=A0A1W2DNS1_9SPHI|nr:FecR family protein [Pedobacter nyackensis]SMC98688.1 FecR family protein [Pedobacter nyackensis]
MTEQEAKALLIKYEKNECTPAERTLVEGWYIQAFDTKELPEGKVNFAAIETEMWSNINASGIQPEQKTIKLWPRISIATAAAMTFLVLGLGIYFFNARYSNHQFKIASENDIAPGRNKATLTLEDGKTILLSGAQKSVIIDANKLSYNDGTEIISIPRTAALVSTPRGGTYQVTLSDGTKVWLNAESTLKFPSSFAGEEQRKVTLKGEAYFEVAKNKKQPFVVSTDKQEVQVLGTHFNINSYPDEVSTKTTLLEGSVRVNQTILTPGHEAVLTNGIIKVNKVNPNEAIDWKNGEFVCNNEPLNSIMRKISRWYDVEVVYSHPELKNKTFSGSLSRYDHVSGVLNALEQAGTIKFKLEGRQIQVL